jgi:hypothetical protein
MPLKPVPTGPGLGQFGTPLERMQPANFTSVA